MLRILLLGCVLTYGLFASKAFSEDAFDSLRLELSLIGSQIEDLRSGLLSPEVRSLAPADAGVALLRLDALEAKLRSMVGRVEAIEFNLEILSRDATHRIVEFNAKLEELESNKEVINAESSAKSSDVKEQFNKSSEMSGEALAFDQALLSFDSRDFESSLDHFNHFKKLYPQSINIAEVYYWLGRTNVELYDYKSAASAFLEAFSQAPTGLFAWKALLGLAVALGDLGQMEQGCLTMAELKSRFPDIVSKNSEELTLAEDQLKCAQ